MLHAIILAGGRGTRLWPESTPSRPKQFLTFQNNTPMIRACYDSLLGLVDPSRIHIVTNQSFIPLVCEAIPSVCRDNIILEPLSKNTAPCIALAAISLLKVDPEATMIVLPSDHIIEPVDSFQDTLRIALDLVEESSDRLVTIGITPDFPSTDYGYIEKGIEFQRFRDPTETFPWDVCEVDQFVEKPDRVTAEAFVSSECYLWNSGIFVWKAREILKLIKKFQPELGEKITILEQSVTDSQFASILNAVYERMESISIDYAVMEHVEKDVFCVKAAFVWNDMGNWTALKRLDSAQSDDSDNISSRCRLETHHSRSNIVRSTHCDQKITLLGVDNLLIVQTEEGLFVANREFLNEIPKLAQEINKDESCT